MFTYPFADNIIKVFFKLAVQILKVTTVADLTAYLAQIETYQKAYDNYAHHFAPDNPAPLEDKPNEEQTELHQCEMNMLVALRMMHEYTRLCMSGKTVKADQSVFNQHRNQLARLPTMGDQFQNPLVKELNRYLAMAAEALTPVVGLHVRDVDQIRDYIASAAKFIDHAYSCEYDPVTLEGVVIQNVPAELIRQISADIKFATSDKRAGAETVGAAVNEWVAATLGNLIGARMCLEFHESGIREIKVSVDEKAASVTSKQLISDLISQIDAVTRLLNLSDYPDYRELYTDHQEKHRLQQKHTKGTSYHYEDRFPVLSSLINLNKLDSDLDIATRLIIRRLEIAESLYHALLVVGETKAELAQLKLFLFSFVDNINLDLRLLIPLVTICSKRKPESTVDLPLLLFYLKNALRLSATLLYVLDPVYCAGLKSTICSAGDNNIILGGFGNVNIASLYALMMQTKCSIKLTDASSPEERIQIFQELADEVRSLFERFIKPGEINQVKTEINFAAQFILDVYIHGWSLCKNEQESDIFLQPVLKKYMSSAMECTDTSLKNANEFLLKMLPELKKPAALARSRHDNDVLVLDAALLGQLNLVNLYGIQALFSGKAVDDYLELGNKFCRLSSVINAVFIKNAQLIAGQQLTHGDQDGKRNADLITKCIAKNKTFMEETAQNVLNRLSFAKTSYRPAGFIRDGKDRSYLPLPQQEKNGKGGKKSHQPSGGKKKKGNQKTVKSQAGKKHPSIEEGFTTLKQFFGDSRKSEMIVFYRNALDNKNILVKLHALVGSAQCLQCFSDETKEQAFADYILSQQPSILKLAHSSLHPESQAPLEKKYHEVMEEWLAIKRPPKEVPKPAPPAKKPDPVFTCSMTLFSTTVVRTLPPPKLVIVDEFADMYEDHELDMEITPFQDAVWTLLEDEGLDPQAHGGRVFDKIFDIKPGDLDLLCFAENVISVVHLLNRHKGRLHIDHVHENVNENVIVVTFKESAVKHEMKKKSDLKLEIYILCAITKKNIALILLARRFGITFLSYDRRRKKILDPLKLFAMLWNEHKFDVQELGVNIHEYLQAYPVRILDIFKRFARCRNKPVPIYLGMTDILNAGVYKQKHHLQAPLNKYAMEKFIRLFLQGYAEIFYKILVEQDCIKHLFPMLHPDHYPALLSACQYVDFKLKGLDVENLPETTTENLLAEFYAKAFFHAFEAAHEIRQYSDHQNQFYIDCNAFIDSLPFEFKYCMGVLSIIQDIWWKIIEKHNSEVTHSSGKLLGMN